MTFAFTLIKELEWSKQFHVDSHFGVPGAEDIPGAQQRFAGLVLFVEAMLQSMEYLNNPSAFDTTGVAGRYAALWAISDMAGIIAPAALPYSTANRTRAVADMMGSGMTPAMTADDFVAMFRGAADAMYDDLPDPVSIREQGIAFRALNWYAADSPTNRAAAQTRMRVIADAVAVASPVDATERTHVIRTLFDANRLFGEASYLDAATSNFWDLVRDYQGADGYFSSQSAYGCDDVATIISALNAVLVLGDAELRSRAEPMLVGFFESAVNLGGMQIAAPPVASLPAYEQLSSELFHRHPSLPMPPAAGGANGTAPVYASRIERVASGWMRTSGTFETGPAMALANEMLWLHSDEVDSFPVIP